MENNKQTAEGAEDGNVQPDRDEGTGARGDFVSSLLLILFGLGVTLESLRMPRFESWGSYARPGFPPLVFGVFLVATSGIVFIRSVTRKGYRLGMSAGGAGAFLAAPSTRRFLFVLLCVAGYYALMGYAFFFQSRFLFSSIAFLIAMMLYFKAGSPWRCVLYSVLVSAGAWLLFEKVFLVPLP